MKQKVVVRSIVRNNNKTLLLRRHAGRPSIVGKFELPGGKLQAGEQPIDTLKRTLRIHAGLVPETAQLFDVISYVDPDDRELQYVFLVYLVSLPHGAERISLSDQYDRYVWKKKSEIQQDDVTNSTVILLSLEKSQIIIPSYADAVKNGDDTSTTSISKMIVYSDGGSRGNPGPSAGGFVIMNDREEVIFEGGEYLGVMTNNLAEYQAVYLALQRAKALGARVVNLRNDSLMVINQLNGIYQVRNRELWPIHDRIRKLAQEFDKVTYTHVKREFNRLADGMVNKILDEKTKSMPFRKTNLAKSAIEDSFSNNDNQTG